VRVLISAFAVVAALLLAAPNNAHAQMAQLQRGMDGMQKRLDKNVFDGRTLHITTWDQMVAVESFARNYQKHLSSAIRAWKSMRNGRTRARLGKLQEAQNYWKALYPQYLSKRKSIKKPVAKARPGRRRPPRRGSRTAAKATRATFASVVTGPGANKTSPVLIDFYGGQETQIQVWGSPGSYQRPSLWSIRMKFAVKYSGFADADVVTAQIYQGRRKRGSAINCKPTILKPWPVAVFECKSEFRNKKKMHKSTGLHSVKLTYKNLVMGKTFKNFGTIRFKPLRLWGGSTTKPNPRWRTDRDMHMGPTTIEMFNANTGGYRSRRSFVAEFQRSALSAVDRNHSSGLILRTWVKRAKYFRTQATCLYKGKPIGWGATNNGSAIDFNVSGRKSKSRRGDYKARWDQLEFELKGLKRVGLNGVRYGFSKPPHWVDQNPGKYKCVITGNGKVIKHVFFTIDAKGDVVKSACQDKRLTTFRTITLVKAQNKRWGEMKYKNGGISFGGVVKWRRSCPK